MSADNIYQIGDKVKGKSAGEWDTCRFKGEVIGHGHSNGQPVILVKIGMNGDYISNKETYMYISAIVVHPDNLERV